MSELNLQYQINEVQFKDEIVSQYTDVIGKKVGGQVLSFLDEWFAAASNLIEPKAPIRDATRFVPSGAWYDGWETRRHNTEEADWVIFKFGVASAQLIAAEVDTAFFNGNHAPYISVEAVSLPDFDDLPPKDVEWETIFPKLECGPSQKFFFKRLQLTEKSYTHARLRMYPDGGIARFRLYGKVNPVLPSDLTKLLDAASVKNGGVAVAFSDQHFGSADNLLLPGRGHDMSDGWETKRSRTPGHVDWVIVKLGFPTKIKEVIVDTAHFKGNFPQRIVVKALKTVKQKPDYFDADWKVVVPESKTCAHKEHVYAEDSLANAVNEDVYTHISLTIIPDGGVKRVRIVGSRE